MIKKLWLYTLLVLLFCSLACGTYFGGKYLVNYWLGDKELTQAETEKLIEERKNDDGILEIQDGERTNILLLGIDARPGEEDARTDTMMLASVDPKLKKIVVISIPRDTRVSLKGSGEQKICAANFFGGYELAESAVKDLLNVDIDYYVKVNFKGFAEIIDALGGVDINVEQRMYHVGTTPDEDIDLYPGLQHLDGMHSLAYVRYRGYITGDIGRTEHQQNFIHELMNVVEQPSTLLKIPKIIGIIHDNMKTDMPLTKMLQVASWAPLFTSESITLQTLPGYFYDVRDGSGNLLNSFWEANKTIAKTLLSDLYNGKTYDVVTSGGGTTQFVKSTEEYDGEIDPEETHESGTDITREQEPLYTRTEENTGSTVDDNGMVDVDPGYLNGDVNSDTASENVSSEDDNTNSEGETESETVTYSDGYEDPFAGTISVDTAIVDNETDGQPETQNGDSSESVSEPITVTSEEAQ